MTGADAVTLPRNGLGAMTTTAISGSSEAFRHLIRQSLAALDAESRAVAELAAVLGHRLNDLCMYALIDLPVGRTMRSMTSLAESHVLRDAGGRLEFANELVRGQCYMFTSAPVSRMLHGSVADRLLSSTGAQDAIPGLEIAWHLVRADRLKRGYAVFACRRARIHPPRCAARSRLSSHDGNSATGRTARQTAILLLVEAQQELGHWAESLQLLDTGGDFLTESETYCGDIFRILAKRWMGQLSAHDMDVSHSIVVCNRRPSTSKPKFA